ncbi:hypothetical protein ILYODFUR_027334 [Ilyodon furcidens]|uniref:Uncharacterized protein n=1 Tax=Ilyodon furcidens TaxID=33524 RepID=A0ABV0SRE3_9TELE
MFLSCGKKPEYPERPRDAERPPAGNQQQSLKATVLPTAPPCSPCLHTFKTTPKIQLKTKQDKRMKFKVENKLLNNQNVQLVKRTESIRSTEIFIQKHSSHIKNI